MMTRRHFRRPEIEAAAQMQALGAIHGWIHLALFLPLLALIGWLNPLSLISVTQAANITAPALHQKATQASDKVSLFWPSDPALCDLVLEGDVQEGDAEALEKAFATIVGDANAFSFF